MSRSTTANNIQVDSKAVNKILIGSKEYASAEELPAHIPAAVRAKLAEHMKATAKSTMNIKVNGKSYSPDKLSDFVRRKLDHNSDGVFNEDDVAALMQSAKKNPDGAIQTSTRTTASSSVTFTSSHLNNFNWRTGIFVTAVIVIILILFV